MDIETDTRIGVEEAAHALGVSTKTIQRYLKSGLLTKIKANRRTYLQQSEVTELVKKKRHGQEGNLLKTELQTTAGDIVTVSRERYEGLLIELGQLRKEREYLMASEIKRQELETALKRAEAELAEARRPLQKSRASPDVPGRNASEADDQSRERELKGRPPSTKPWWQK